MCGDSSRWERSSPARSRLATAFAASVRPRRSGLRGGGQLLLGRFFSGVRRGPVLLEHGNHLADDLRIVDNDANLPAFLELQLAEALAADERARAVADDGPHVQPPSEL